MRVSADVLQRAHRVLDAARAEKDALQRAETLEALGMSRRKDARELLVAALVETVAELRFSAARGLRYLRDSSVEEALAKAWKREKGWAVKKEMALAAGTIGARSFVPMLKEALAPENRDELRIAAAFALQDLGDTSGNKVLQSLGNPDRTYLPKDGTDRWGRKVLQDEREGDKVLAARTLAEVGTPEDAVLLAPYLESRDFKLRLWSAAAIVSLSH